MKKKTFTVFPATFLELGSSWSLTYYLSLQVQELWYSCGLLPSWIVPGQFHDAVISCCSHLAIWDEQQGEGWWLGLNGCWNMSWREHRWGQCGGQQNSLINLGMEAWSMSRLILCAAEWWQQGGSDKIMKLESEVVRTLRKRPEISGSWNFFHWLKFSKRFPFFMLKYLL